MKQDLNVLKELHEAGSGDLVRIGLQKYGIPQDRVDQIWAIAERQTNDGLLWDQNHDQYIGRYQFFVGIEQPLFYFNDLELMKQKVEIIDGVPHPQFRLNTYVHHNASLVIYGEHATEHLHTFIRVYALTNLMTSPGYKINQEAGAFFQGGFADPKGQFIYIEFWKPKGAQAFVDYVNKEYPIWYKKSVGS